MHQRRFPALIFACATLAAATACASRPAQFASAWQAQFDGPWLGPDYWANPMQDWRVRDGAAECFASGGERSLALLTHDLSADGALNMDVGLAPLDAGAMREGAGYVGFRFGLNGVYGDYRDTAVYGRGFSAGVTHAGVLFIGATEGAVVPQWPGEIRLRLKLAPAGGRWTARLTAFDAAGEELGVVERTDLERKDVAGGLGLACHDGAVDASREPPATPPERAQDGLDVTRHGATRAAFRDWRIGGGGLAVHRSRALGPIAFTLFTQSRGTLKLTAQMLPVAQAAGAAVELQVKNPAGDWSHIAAADIDPAASTATFRVEHWPRDQATPYRVRYNRKRRGAAPLMDVYEGVIPADPVDKPELTIAALSCFLDTGFPHADMTPNVAAFAPDLMVFSGDEIYEINAGYGVEWAEPAAARLDYLRKWIQFGWAFGETTRNRPAVATPDDHDVFHGNLWGAGGRKTLGRYAAGQDPGGYVMPPDWINMVQRTQTSHLPDPHDPTPVEQGIGVYYTAMLYGGVSFAILEDRKWKSAPKPLIPSADIYNGFARNPDYDPARDGDVAGASLLGERQMAFLEAWTRDWSNGAQMKAVLSQTPFLNLQTLPTSALAEGGGKPAEPAPAGVYPTTDEPTVDHDSNGWPQTPRTQALRLMRRAFAPHIVGDQHLGATFQYGVDDWRDGVFGIVSPAVSNIWPRRWYPQAAVRSLSPELPRYTGDFKDGFGNLVTVHAVANPQATGHARAYLHDRAPGYAIVVFNKAERRITASAWPRSVDVAAKGAKPYPGWPVTFSQLDNGFPADGLTLPVVDADAAAPILQVVDATTQETLYMFRLKAEAFTPKVRTPGRYLLRRYDDAMRLVGEIEAVAK